MEQLLLFLTQHWMLSCIFIVLFLALITNEFILYKASGSQSLSPAEVVQWINHKEAVLIDIRPSQSFSEGHILGSLNLSADALEKKNAALEKLKERNLIIVCAAGQSSQKVVAELKRKGFKVCMLSGGLQAWRNAGLPLSKN